MLPTPPPWPNAYAALPDLTAPAPGRAGYALMPIRATDREAIRQWRNAQLNVLRQTEPLSVAAQDSYFESTVRPLFSQPQPNQLLFSLLLDGALVAYGGLVHLHWPDQRGEVSFLADPARVADPATYRTDFQAHLRQLAALAFGPLKLNRLFTETYDVRPAHVAILEEIGFRPEGRLRQHVRLAGTFVDSLLHGLLAADYVPYPPELPVS
ncbi:GNAT family N-acetyltransferase [uncultured Hymenobacter sp.]|uniref:GNAT family N-acetyltransferase n=1 Tax=uncultured Hymenobacter sp. TaxID=170016 RepID=UPI0035CA1491